MAEIYSRELTVHFYDCDLFGRMRLSAVNRALSDIAYEDYTVKGMSHRWLWDHGFVFLLSKVSILFENFPSPGDQVVLSTWEREIKGAAFFRSYEMKTQTGDSLLQADSAWMLVNPHTRQILRPKDFPYANPTGLPVDCPPCGKLRMEEGTLAGHRLVVYSDLDGNGHLYNATYADIAMDFLTPKTQQRQPRSYQINFLHEAKQGDTLEIFIREEENASFVKGKLGDRDSFVAFLGY